MKKFKLGKLQKYWLEQLRKHPERQLHGILGQGTPRNYKACCLGELHLCAARLKKKKLPFKDNDNIADGSHDAILGASYEKYGLREPSGASRTKFQASDGNHYSQLSAANDNGIKWPEIADIIEKNPKNFFNESV